MQFLSSNVFWQWLIYEGYAHNHFFQLNIIAIILFRERNNCSQNEYRNPVWVFLDTLIKHRWSSVPTYSVEEFGLGTFTLLKKTVLTSISVVLYLSPVWELLTPISNWITDSAETGNIGPHCSEIFCFSSELNRVLKLSPFTGQKFTLPFFILSLVWARRHCLTGR